MREDELKTRLNIFRKVLFMAKETMISKENLARGMNDSNRQLLEVDLAYMKGSIFAQKAILSTIALEIQDDLSACLGEIADV